MTEHNLTGILAVAGIIIPMLLFTAYVMYDQKKMDEERKRKKS